MSAPHRTSEFRDNKENRVGSPKNTGFDPHKNVESKQTDTSGETVSDQIKKYAQHLEDLKKPNKKSLFSELKERYTSDNILHETAVESQDYLQAQREESKKLVGDLEVLKRQAQEKPDNASPTQNWNERLKQLATFSWNKDSNTKEIDTQIDATLQYKKDLDTKIKKTHECLRQVRRRLNIEEHPYYIKEQRINYEPEPEGCTLIRGLQEAKCGPSCLAMVLSLHQRSIYGEPLSPRLAAEKFDRGRIDEGGGTPMEDYPEVLRRCRHPISYIQDKLRSIDQLRQKLSPDTSGQVQPVIAEVYEQGDPHSHVVVITGIEKGTAMFNGKEYDTLLYKVLDPYDGMAYKLTEENFREMWTGRTVFAKGEELKQEIAQVNEPRLGQGEEPILGQGGERGLGKRKRDDFDGTIVGGGGDAKKQKLDKIDKTGLYKISPGEEDNNAKHSNSGGISFSGGGFAGRFSLPSWLGGPGQEIDDTVPVGGDYSFPNRNNDLDQGYYSDLDS